MRTLRAYFHLLKFKKKQPYTVPRENKKLFRIKHLRNHATLTRAFEVRFLGYRDFRVADRAVDDKSEKCSKNIFTVSLDFLKSLKYADRAIVIT